jgi:glycine/D-amino acid oxidase-like deaminating enzyme
MVTHPKDLRTGQPIWSAPRQRGVARGRLAGDISTDVLIIGAGITGAMIAQALSASGRDVVVVDKRGAAKGSTAASTALVQYEIDTSLIALTRKIGKIDAIRAWRRSRLALDALLARLDALKPGLTVARPTLFLEGNELDAQGLLHEKTARQAAGLTSVFLKPSEVRSRFGISGRAALFVHGGFVINPRTTTLELLRTAMRRKTRIFAPVEVIDLKHRGAAVVATTDHGFHITAQHVVFATGYELPKGLPQTGHKVISTWAMATPPQRRRLWLEECMIWEASDPYLYLRTTPDGRVICGGEDEDFSDEAARDRLLSRKVNTLSRKLKRLLPNIDAEAEFGWTGSFGKTRTGLPKIGPMPGKPRCWVALGYGGNGITYAQIASDIILGALSGEPDIDADLYALR